MQLTKQPKTVFIDDEFISVNTIGRWKQSYRQYFGESYVIAFGTEMTDEFIFEAIRLQVEDIHAQQSQHSEFFNAEGRGLTQQQKPFCSLNLHYSPEKIMSRLVPVSPVFTIDGRDARAVMEGLGISILGQPIHGPHSLVAIEARRMTPCARTDLGTQTDFKAQTGNSTCRKFGPRPLKVKKTFTVRKKHRKIIDNSPKVVKRKFEAVQKLLESKRVVDPFQDHMDFKKDCETL